MTTRQFSWWARQWQAFSYCLYLTRFSVLVLIVTLALLLAAQGQDLLISIAEDRRYFAFVGDLLLWGASVWLWARVLLDIRFPTPPTDRGAYNFWRRHVPRLLGALAFGSVAVATARTDQCAVLMWLALGAGAVFWLLLAYRRDLARVLAARLAPDRPTTHWLWAAPIADDETPPHANLVSALKGMRGRFAMTTALLGIVLFFTAWLQPVTLGNWLGALLLLMLAGATWLPVGSTIAYLSSSRGIPLLTLLLAAALIFSLWNDNHEIRRAAADLTPASRPTVDEALAAWKTHNCVNEQCRSMVIIAAAGGGARAAYWTGTVLGRLHDAIPGFDNAVFAISGVSGGSVGAAVYRALITKPEALDEACRASIEDCALRILAQDFLGPVSAAMLYPDLLQRFLPRPWLPDRGVALEQAWERAFADASAVSGIMDGSMTNLSATRPWPALFLNATWVGNGRRIIASNLRIDPQTNQPDAAFERANDQLARLGYDIPLSTAAHNSARFPLVSPPGMWRDAAGNIAGRLQDGGLFENFGAQTALEILDAVCRRFTCSRDEVSFPSQEKPQLTPIVLVISSDPGLPDNVGSTPENPPLRFAYEIRSTLRSYERARSGRGAELADQLTDWAQTYGRLADFRMCRRDQQLDPPLGWALSEAARKRIHGYLGAQGCAGNAAAFINVQHWLRGR